jgi:Cu/Ag efflux protein CusF
VVTGCYRYGTIRAKLLNMKFNKILKWRSKSMKKVLMIALAVLISVAFVTTVFAQDKKAEKPAAAAEKAAPAAEKAPKAEKAAAPAADKPAKAEKAEKPAKAKAQTFKGEFVSADAAAKTIVAKNDKGDMTFDVSKIKKMAEFKAGDKVAVVYMEKDGKNWAKSVKAVKAAKKDAPKKEKVEKPADKPADKAPVAAPAPAPAPAPKK